MYEPIQTQITFYTFLILCHFAFAMREDFSHKFVLRFIELSIQYPFWSTL